MKDKPVYGRSFSKMSRDMMHAYFKSFAYDPFMFQENENTPTYIYDQANVDQLYSKHPSHGKLHFAILYDRQSVGDIYLKDIDLAAQTCEMGIHIVNDNYKGKGYAQRQSEFYCTMHLQN